MQVKMTYFANIEFLILCIRLRKIMTKYFGEECPTIWPIISYINW